MKTKIIVPLIMLILISNTAFASICTVSGFVEDSSGTPVPEGTPVIVKNLNTLAVYMSSTGNSWPYQNYYSVSFACTLGVDNAVVSVSNSEKEVLLEKTETIADIILDQQDQQDEQLDRYSTSSSSIKTSQKDLKKQTYTEYISTGGFDGEIYIINILDGEDIILTDKDVVIFYLGDLASGIASYILKQEDAASSMLNISIQEYNKEKRYFSINPGENDIDIRDTSIDIHYTPLEDDKSLLKIRAIPKQPLRKPTSTAYDNILLYISITFLLAAGGLKLYHTRKNKRKK
ncbi:hypothetical protein GF336_01485 [Candidatus Woesearchaeota archaeon]|nr:hypothetical protein [Candidatus Woesearchaeota archaeon]